ncbi:hypothetical protein BJ944DRAFT_268736 [Cunninghamella echinulata]|nr:hypothetical protein BJ944DRAFT_268736 [Cunninghamella echinulata]
MTRIYIYIYTFQLGEPGVFFMQTIWFTLLFSSYFFYFFLFSFPSLFFIIFFKAIYFIKILLHYFNFISI